MSEQEVVRLYVEENLSLRGVARRLDTDHHTIKRVLVKAGVEIVKKPRPPITEEHRRKISEGCKGRTTWCKGRKMSEESCRKNMARKMKTKIDLNKYDNFEKLKLLTRLISKRRSKLAPDDKAREAFLDRFYFDKDFSAIYEAWVKSKKNKWYYPSLDHKLPSSKGGTFSLDNLQFITWFENRAKCDMDLDEWTSFKKATRTKSALFI